MPKHWNMRLLSLISRKKCSILFLTLVLAFCFTLQFIGIDKNWKYFSGIKTEEPKHNEKPLIVAKEVEHFTDWQPVSGTKDKTRVYSAYYDSRSSVMHIVRIIGIAKNSFSETLHCIFKFPNGLSKTVKAKAEQLMENNNSSYAAHFFLCPVPGMDEAPTDVSLAGNLSLPVTNTLPVMNTDIDQKNLNTEKIGTEFIVCTKPFYYNYDNATELAEFIEYYLLMGVKNFIFYNYSIGRKVECILRSYVQRNVATLFPYTYNVVEIPCYYAGQMATIQDCVYRYMYKAKHILIVDPDEYIVPHYRKATLNELVAHVVHRFGTTVENVASLIFRNSYFYLFRPDYLPGNFVTPLRKTERTEVFPPNDRTKCVINPRRIVQMGIHFPWELMGDAAVIDVPAEIGLSHHYRKCQALRGPPDSCNKVPVVNDTTMWNYKNDYVSSMDRAVKLIKETCPHFK